ncbi:MAG: hypothetical protein ABSA45_05275 [Verrucomicrobiota bacterium]
MPENNRNGQFNTAVLIDRQGQVAGYYRKVFVFWGDPQRRGDQRDPHQGREGVKEA